MVLPFEIAYRNGLETALAETRLREQALLKLRDDLRGFRGRPRLQGLRANVPEFPDLEKELHRGLVIRRLRHRDEVVFAHREEDVHLRAQLVREGTDGVRALRRLLHVLDSLFCPINEADVLWHVRSLQGAPIIVCVYNAVGARRVGPSMFLAAQSSSRRGFRARQIVVPGILRTLASGNTSEYVLSFGNGSGSRMSVTTKPASVRARCQSPYVR